MRFGEPHEVTVAVTAPPKRTDLPDAPRLRVDCLRVVSGTSSRKGVRSTAPEVPFTDEPARGLKPRDGLLSALRNPVLGCAHTVRLASQSGGGHEADAFVLPVRRIP